MLCTANSGKYLYGKYARERAKAMEDKELFSQAQLDYLEISGTDGTAIHQDRTFLIPTQPIDSNPLKHSQPQKEKIDIREFPQMGGEVTSKLSHAGSMARERDIFEFNVIDTQVISGQFSTIAGHEISVDWGDGTACSTYIGTNRAWSHDYGSASSHTVRIFNSGELTKFTMDDISGANISFDIASLPAGLKHLTVAGSNTLFGDIANAPTGLTTLSVSGSNTLFGDIANAPTGLTFLVVSGSNTIADYTTPHTWTTKPTMFVIVPVTPGGLSQTGINNLLIDLDDDLVWASGTIIMLTGTNAAPTPAPSDAATAIANMVAEGVMVLTN